MRVLHQMFFRFKVPDTETGVLNVCKLDGKIRKNLQKKEVLKILQKTYIPRACRWLSKFIADKQ